MCIETIVLQKIFLHINMKNVKVQIPITLR